jgi:hypothetical protein
MVYQRSLYGFRDNDTATALTVAREAVRVSDSLRDEALQGRAYFWYALALYYSGDSKTAQDMFERAEDFAAWVVPSRVNIWLKEWVGAVGDMEVGRRKEDYWSKALFKYSKTEKKKKEKKSRKRKHGET